jgi:hypothetical protein
MHLKKEITASSEKIVTVQPISPQLSVGTVKTKACQTLQMH